MPEDENPVTATVDALRRHPVRAMWLGVALQAAALGIAAWAVWHETKRETAAAEATKYLWRLGWHDALHHMPWLALMIACLLLYVVGALLFAMRFAPHHAGRVLAILITLLVGLAVLGAIVIVFALVAAALSALGLDAPEDFFAGLNWWPDWGNRRSRRSGG